MAMYINESIFNTEDSELSQDLLPQATVDD